MNRWLATAGAAIGLLAVVIAVRTARYGSERPVVEAAPGVPIAEGAAGRLAGALRFPTIAPETPASIDAAAFRALHDHLAAAFPRTHATLKRETVGGHSLLYTWPGGDPSCGPILLAGHLDVVPVDPVGADRWQEEPFGGRVAGGFIWGRGAIDNKAAVTGTLEAVEMLLAEGFRPARTVHLAYGHDEESGGMDGARAIATLLKGRGAGLAMVLDEGGVIGDGVLAGIDAPVALVGIAEKGFVNLELSVRTAGGHSSLPPAGTTIGILAAAIVRLEDRPMPARLAGPTRALFDSIGAEFPWARRSLFANLWISRPLVTRSLQQSPTTNAMVRTTMAATVFRAGTAGNVLPAEGRVVVNVRILPGDSVAGVVAHVRRVIDDPRIGVRPVGALVAEPSPVSDHRSAMFGALERAIRGVDPDVIVAPYLVVVATDARHYAPLSREVYRFLPLRLTTRDLDRMHGTDERIAVAGYEGAIRTYRRILLEIAGGC